MDMDIQKLADDFRATGGLTGIKTTPPAKIVVNGESKATKCSDPKTYKEEKKQYSIDRIFFSDDGWSENSTKPHSSQRGATQG